MHSTLRREASYLSARERDPSFEGLGASELYARHDTICIS
jgi:hypothetical protein